MVAVVARKFNGTMVGLRPARAFVFPANETQSFFSSILEPILTDGGGARLGSSGVTHREPLTNQQLEDAVDRVDTWSEVVRSVKQSAEASRA
jgi:hypothetical protein